MFRAGGHQTAWKSFFEDVSTIQMDPQGAWHHAASLSIFGIKHDETQYVIFTNTQTKYDIIRYHIRPYVSHITNIL